MVLNLAWGGGITGPLRNLKKLGILPRKMWVYTWVSAFTQGVTAELALLSSHPSSLTCTRPCSLHPAEDYWGRKPTTNSLKVFQVWPVFTPLCLHPPTIPNYMQAAALIILHKPENSAVK